MIARTEVNPRSLPKQDRAQATYDLLLDVAGELLGEVGIERISTNMICARAGLTPPALYRYFKDKYAVLEALGQRLMTKQNDALEAWILRHVDQGTDALGESFAHTHTQGPRHDEGGDGSAHKEPDLDPEG